MSRGGSDTDCVLVSSANAANINGALTLQVVTVNLDDTGASQILTTPTAQSAGGVVVDSTGVPGFFVSPTGADLEYDVVTSTTVGTSVVTQAAGANVLGGAVSGDAIGALFTASDGLSLAVRSASAQAFSVTSLTTEVGGLGDFAIDETGAPWSVYGSSSSGGNTSVLMNGGTYQGGAIISGVTNLETLGITLDGAGNAIIAALQTTDDGTGSFVGQGTLAVASSDAVNLASVGGPNLPNACNVAALNLLSCGSCPAGMVCNGTQDDVLALGVAATSDGTTWMVEDHVTADTSYAVQTDESLDGLVCTCDVKRQSVSNLQQYLTIAPIGSDGTPLAGVQWMRSAPNQASSVATLHVDGRGHTLHILVDDGGLVERLVVDTSLIAH
jgi:hypothetical protein